MKKIKREVRLITDPATKKSVYTKKRAKFLARCFANKSLRIKARVLKVYGSFVTQVTWS